MHKNDDNNKQTRTTATITNNNNNNCAGVMTGDPVTVTVSEVLLLLAPGSTLSDPEAGLAARRMAAALREMFANRYAEDFLEDALGVKLEDKMSV